MKAVIPSDGPRPVMRALGTRLRVVLVAATQQRALLTRTLEAAATVSIEHAESLACARAALSRGEYDALVVSLPCAALAVPVELPEFVPRILVTAELSEEAVRAAQRLGAILCSADHGAEQLAPLLVQAAATSAARRAERARTEFDAEQVRILELVANGAPLRTVLERIVTVIERFGQGVCSVLLLDPRTKQMRHGAAPSLPHAYIEAVDGQAAGIGIGSCGEAAYTGEPVFVRDIAQHPHWEPYRHLALPHGLRACWSSPILSPEREVLGTFAVYYREPREPQPEELERVGSAAHLAALAIMRERHERALHMSEVRQRQLLETSHEGVLMLDPDGGITFANERAAAMLAREVRELLGLDFRELVHPSERASFLQRWTRHNAGDSEQYELRMTTRGGDDLWVIVAASPVMSESGEVTGTLKMLTDISRRRRTEQALAQSEIELRAIFESTAIGVALIDTVARPRRFNSALARIVGYSQEELKQMSLLTLVHPADRAAVEEHRARLDAGEFASTHLEHRIVRKGGEPVWVRAHCSRLRWPEPTDLSGVLVFEDITEGRRLAQALRAEERLLEHIFQSVTEVICYFTVEGSDTYRFVSVNRAFCAAVGMAPEYVIGRRLDEVITVASLPSLFAHFGEAVRTAEPVRWEENVYLPAGLECADVLATPICEGGVCTHLIATSRFITERKRAEAKIAEQAALLDRASDAIIVRDLDQIVRYWNGAAARLYGFAPEEAIGRPLPSLIRDDTDEVAEQRLLAEGAFTGELTQYDKTGRELIVDSSWTLLRDREGNPESVLIINNDVSEKKRLRTQMLLAQRMESLGTLAGGIAHDFNNILAAIRGYLELALHRLPLTDAAREPLTIVRDATDRAVELVHQILTFSRHQPSQREACLLEPVVEEVLRLLRATLPRMITLEAEYAPGGFAVMVDTTQIHQIVMNLGTNAAQALGDHGAIVLRLAPVQLSESLAGVASEVPAGSYMCLTVADNGCGMNEETLARVFDPFFTTKAPGMGTGLGLSVVLGIVKEHGGTLRVSSTRGSGTSFEIYFPEASASKVSTRPPAPGQLVRGRGERILYIDDEEWLLELARVFLEDLGYVVEGYESPGQALSALCARPEEFDAVVTDLAMGEMSGIELAFAARGVRADIPIFMCSGYWQREQREEARRAGVYALLEKPDFLLPLAGQLARFFQTGSSVSH